MSVRGLSLALGVMAVVAGVAALLWEQEAPDWSPAQRAILRSLWLGGLGPVPDDPSNRAADDPLAVALGQSLFFDPRLSRTEAVSCATCHRPERYFTDGLARARAAGEGPRNTPTVVGAAYSPWLFWDGRKDSLWAQALVPLEHPLEHGDGRVRYARVIARHYRDAYEPLFGPLPTDLEDSRRFPPGAGPNGPPSARRSWQAMAAADRKAVTRVFVNMGKAIAAYERRLLPGPSRFDRFVAAMLAGDGPAMRAALSPDEQAGLRLFIGRARCVQCHNGPLLTNNAFHNTGVPALGLAGDRARAVRQVLEDPYNCLGPWSDAPQAGCEELRFIKRCGAELLGALRTPSLRNVSATAPYMSQGQLATLREVLEHYNTATDWTPLGHSDLSPLRLDESQLRQLEAFLRSLQAPVLAPARLLHAPRSDEHDRLAGAPGGPEGADHRRPAPLVHQTVPPIPFVGE
jgi:cytochrome c peroxidase